jgi:hypothetical protein
MLSEEIRTMSLFVPDSPALASLAISDNIRSSFYGLNPFLTSPANKCHPRLGGRESCQAGERQEYITEVAHPG